jgi:hypothetical protein
MLERASEAADSAAVYRDWNGNELAVCDFCGRMVYSYEVSEKNGAYFCHKCQDLLFGYCKVCEKFIDKRKAALKNGEWYCYDCADEHFTYCYRCQRQIPKTEAHSYSNEHYCNECFDFIMIKFVMQYSEKPKPIFHFRNPVSGEIIKTDYLTGRQNQYTFIGVELETSLNAKKENYYEVENIARKAVSIFSGNPNSKYYDITDIYAKQDGSIGDHGIEFVTHPMTIEIHRAYHYQEMFEYLLDEGYTSHDSKKCGIHTHINRTCFGSTKEAQKAGIYNLLLIFTLFPNEFKKFSRRNEEQIGGYCTLFEMPKDKDLIYFVEHMPRSMAVNLQNESTVEIRIFNGTLKYNSFIATLEFVDELVRLSKEMNPRQLKRMKWSSFVSRMRGRYKELDQYLTERELN